MLQVIVFIVILVIASGIAVYKFSDDSDAKEKRARDLEKARAAHVKDIEKKNNDLKENREYFDIQHAYCALAVACATCDGPIVKDEQDAINVLVFGDCNDVLPDVQRQRIQKLFKEPPAAVTAFELAKNHLLPRKGHDANKVRNFLKDIALADAEYGRLSAEESAFLSAWDKYVNSGGRK